MDTANQQLIEKNEIVFDAPIVEDGKVVNEQTVHGALANLVKNKGLKNSKLYFIVPDQFVTMKQEEIPAQLTYQEGLEYIKLQTGNTIRLPFKDPVIDFETLNHLNNEEQNTHQQKILLFAYPKVRIKKLQQMFESVGFLPEMADVSFLSVYRAYNHLNQLNTTEEYEKHLLMVQWHKFDIALTVFHQGVPVFNRHTHIPASAQSWKKDEMSGEWEWARGEEELERTIEEQLMAIERFMDFYRYSVTDGEASITDIFLKGGFPRLDSVREQMHTQYGLNVERITLPYDLEDEYASLYGLTLKEASMKERLKRIREEKKEKKQAFSFLQNNEKKSKKDRGKTLKKDNRKKKES
jgi:type IV pilus assembly protein PilM